MVTRSSRFKKFASFMVLAAALVTLGVSIVAIGLPARAEENLGDHDVITELGHYKYTTFLYPNLSQAFYLPPKYETRFDIHNGKFWKVEYYEWIGEERSPLLTGIRQEPNRDVHLRFDLAFYTPRGELIQRLNLFRPNWWYSLPHNKVSLEYDRLQVRIRNHTVGNRDFRFVVLDPVDPVKGTPIPPARDIHL